MNDQPSPPVETDRRKPPTSLVERLDPAIGETSGVMGAMLTELIRRTLRGSVVQIDDELHGHVAEKVDAAVTERLPYIEQSAAEVADKTARVAATEVATEEVRALEGRTQESCRSIEAKIEETARSAQQVVEETARTLGGRIVEVEQKTGEALTTKARDLATRIEETEKQVTQSTQETARGLARQIEEAERRANEAAQTEIQRQVEDLLDRSRKATTLLKDRLTHLDSTAAGLGRQLLDEANERKAEHKLLRTDLEQRATVLHQQLQTAAAEVQALEGRLRQELDEALRQNQALAARVAELEKPRGLRRLWLWVVGLFGGRKRRAAANADGSSASEVATS